MKADTDLLTAGDVASCVLWTIIACTAVFVIVVFLWDDNQEVILSICAGVAALIYGLLIIIAIGAHQIDPSDDGGQNGWRN